MEQRCMPATREFLSRPACSAAESIWLKHLFKGILYKKALVIRRIRVTGFDTPHQVWQTIAIKKIEETEPTYLCLTGPVAGAIVAGVKEYGRFLSREHSINASQLRQADAIIVRFILPEPYFPRHDLAFFRKSHRVGENHKIFSFDFDNFFDTSQDTWYLNVLFYTLKKLNIRFNQNVFLANSLAYKRFLEKKSSDF
ncbi:MAG: hypothetical protein PVJ09_03020 [Candidatus Woesebacteria bacterium]|jgi:hypothetical protein